MFQNQISVVSQGRRLCTVIDDSEDDNYHENLKYIIVVRLVTL